TPDAGIAVVRMYIRQGTNVFAADFGYALSVTGGNLGFAYLGANGNGEIIKDAVTPLLDYFSNNQFGLAWYADPSVSIYPRIRFSPVANPNNYFLARLYP